MKRQSTTSADPLDNSVCTADPSEAAAKRSKFSASDPPGENDQSGNAAGMLVVRSVSQINSSPAPWIGSDIEIGQDSEDVALGQEHELHPVDPVASSSTAPHDDDAETITNANAAPPNTDQVKQEADTLDSKVGIKTEVKDEVESPSTDTPAQPPPVPIRPTCNFGIKCYLRNPLHRNAMAHPGDSDYRRPAYPPAPPGTPDCPFGASCYRRNPQHFLQLQHPPSDSYNTLVTPAIPIVSPPQRQPNLVPYAQQPQPADNQHYRTDGRPDYHQPGNADGTDTEDEDDGDDENDDDAFGYLFDLSTGDTSDEYNPTSDESEDDD